ncbi:MAG: tetratricopeptide repeat protein [Xanthomonadales bacterium]|nr:tetratricopeptide repeat protein [Gammaproteobacteria bacterium]MBT8054741.1 tetratricopeptide repeat protein [Gammaproteobacteria bacterium]NND58534.1 tetratricopeptide repeat protein [Xanthomonadales bacterium]NNK52228.1 tetratricopeptide repeat protein [Xanthomonadales bacterium]
MAVVVVSCATRQSGLVVGEEPITAEMVLIDSPLSGSLGGGDVSQREILLLSTEMTAFLDKHIDRDANQNLKLAQLIYAVIGEDRFLLSYDDSTRTAAGTFASRRGNCISFTNMFVAMARDVGLKVNFQEVDIPPDWSMTGETVLLSQHVNALVDMKSALSRVVDFNTLEYNVKNEARVISDERARAHFFNNIGVEHMLADESGRAFANFQQSIKEDESFSPAWVNMGILHRREGYPSHAEVAYMEALEHDKLNLMAMSNLANLYEEQGKPEQARWYLSKVQSHRMKNPYYRYQLANTAFNEGDYREAIKNLKMAIRQRDDDDRLYFLLSLSYLMSGDKAESQRWMQKAEEVAEQTEDQKKYHHKLDLLRNPGSGL